MDELLNSFNYMEGRIEDQEKAQAMAEATNQSRQEQLKIKSEIKELGEINPNALQDYAKNVDDDVARKNLLKFRQAEHLQRYTEDLEHYIGTQEEMAALEYDIRKEVENLDYQSVSDLYQKTMEDGEKPAFDGAVENEDIMKIRFKAFVLEKILEELK